MTRPRLRTTHLATLAAALTAAFILLPRPFARLMSGHDHGNEQHLQAAVTTAFVDYWHAGQRTLTPELSHLVDYWRWFHVLKAATAVGLLIVLIVLASRLWRAYGRSGLVSAAVGGGAATVLSVVALAATMANLQGTIAPFSSLMSMLPVRSPRGDLAVMVDDVKDQAAHYSSQSPGALQRMVDDLATYHVVIVVAAGSTALVLAVLAIVAWHARRRTVTTERRTRRLLGGLGVAAVVMAGLLAVLALGNQSAVADSPTAVLNFYRGSF